MADEDLQYDVGEAPKSEQPKSYEWEDIPAAAVKNFVPSAIEAGKSMVQPFMHPIETGKAIGQMGTGAYSKAKGALGFEQDPQKKATDEAALDAIGQFYKDRYGTTEGFKRALAEDPAGVIADISSVATLGGGAAARAPGLIGKAGKIVSKVGEFTDPISVASKTAPLVTKATAIPFWWKSGASFKSLDDAAKAGATLDPNFIKHLGGIASPNELVDDTMNAIQKIADEKNMAYQQGMSSLDKSKTLNYNDIVKKWADEYDNAIHLGKTYDETTKEALDRAGMKIREWVDQPMVEGAHGIIDMDKLKRAISEIRKDYPPNSPAAKALSNVRKSVYDTIATGDPKYAEIMENYQKALDEFNDIRHEFASGKKTTSKKMRAIIKAQNSATGGELIDRLAEVDPSLPFKIAGQELGETLPYGMRGWLSNALVYGSMGGAPAIVGAAASSPRIAGGTQYALGALTQAPLRAAEKYVPRMARAGEYGLAEVTGHAIPKVEGEEGETKPQQMPELSDELEYSIGRSDGGRIARASGGRISPVSAAQKLMIAAERAKKNISKGTEALLDHPDEHIAKALDIAKQHI